MLLSIPEVTEQQTKGNTPRVDCRPLIPEGAHSKVEFVPLQAVAFAYAHVTRRGHFGQRTEHLHTVEGSASEQEMKEVQAEFRGFGRGVLHRGGEAGGGL